MDNRIEVLCKMIEEQQRARMRAQGLERCLEGSHYTGKVKYGRKYANVDFGGSGRYMVVLETGEIFGVKAYGVIHRGHSYGTLDTITDYDWSDYRAVRKQKQAA